MTEETENSSLPLLLSITGAVVLVAVGGWFFLEADPVVQEEAPPLPVASAPASTDGASNSLSSVEELEHDDEPLQLVAETAALPDRPDDSAAEAGLPAASDAPDVEAELRKARLAADADILVFPEDQSALHYYGKALAMDAAHPVAMAELEAVLGRVLQTVNDHLESGEWNAAHRIAVQVAKYRPGHALVTRTQETLDASTEQLVNQAIEVAQDGEYERAEELLVSAERLPGRNPQYFTAVRESIAEMQRARLAAEEDRAARAALADEAAKTAWLDRINSAIANGNLIAPSGASARDLLRETNAWVEERQALQAELLSSLVARTEQFVAADRLEEAETYLNAAVEVSGDPGGFAELRTAIEERFVEKESGRIAQMTELVRLKTVPARYPRRAGERGITGWVDVLFTVSPSGETTDIEIYAAEPENIFDRAAIEAVEQWEFQPVEYRGRVISQRAGAKLVFRLEE